MNVSDMTTEHLVNSISWHENHIVKLIDEYYTAMEYEYNAETLNGHVLSNTSDLIQNEIDVYNKKLKELKKELYRRQKNELV